MKKIAILSLILFAVALCSKLSNANLVHNPSFEDGVDSPDEWEKQSSTNETASCSWDDMTARTGLHSVKIGPLTELNGFPHGNAEWYSSYTSDIPFDNTKDYVISVYSYWDAPPDDTKDYAWLCIKFQSENRLNIFCHVVSNQYPDWHYNSYTVSQLIESNPPDFELETVDYIGISLKRDIRDVPSSNASVYFDDVTFDVIDFSNLTDSDNDSIPDDGDSSGVVGDAPCTIWSRVYCDDNCPSEYNPDQLDSDGDGVGNACESSPTTIPTTTTTTIPSSTTTSTTNPPCPTETLYGEHSEQTELLRYLRDDVLSTTPEGQEIIRLYYEWSPLIVKAMEEDEGFKEEVKEMIDVSLKLIKVEDN